MGARGQHEQGQLPSCRKHPAPGMLQDPREGLPSCPGTPFAILPQGFAAFPGRCRMAGATNPIYPPGERWKGPGMPWRGCRGFSGAALGLLSPDLHNTCRSDQKGTAQGDKPRHRGGQDRVTTGTWPQGGTAMTAGTAQLPSRVTRPRRGDTAARHGGQRQSYDTGGQRLRSVRGHGRDRGQAARGVPRAVGTHRPCLPSGRTGSPMSPLSPLSPCPPRRRIAVCAPQAPPTSRGHAHVTRTRPCRQATPMSPGHAHPAACRQVTPLTRLGDRDRDTRGVTARTGDSGTRVPWGWPGLQGTPKGWQSPVPQENWSPLSPPENL